MAKLNPTQAADEWKIGKSTLYRDMDNGKLSYSTDDGGKRLIESSEMLRVYGGPKYSTDDQKSESGSSMVVLMREMLERQEKSSAELVRSLQSQIDSQRDQINKLMESQEHTTKLLLHFQESIQAPENKPVTTPEEQKTETKDSRLPEQTQQPAKRKKSLFSRLLSAAIED